MSLEKAIIFNASMALPEGQAQPGAVGVKAAQL